MDVSAQKQICLWMRLAVAFSIMAVQVTAFQPAVRLTTQWSSHAGSSARHMAPLDPTDLVNAAAAVQHHASDATTLNTLISTMYSSSVDGGLLTPAHGHSQPLFGPSDPYLTAGHSIVPNLKAFGDAAISKAPAVDQLPAVAQTAIKQGWKVFDASNFEASGGSTLPGFTQTGGILPHHVNIPDESMTTFTAQVIGSAKFLGVLEKLPLLAFLYVLVDFFLLRPGVDLYKEDIEEEPLDVAAETVAVTSVRLAAFSGIAFLAVLIFG